VEWKRGRMGLLLGGFYKAGAASQGIVEGVTAAGGVLFNDDGFNGFEL
jgi:hypothetical protein